MNKEAEIWSQFLEKPNMLSAEIKQNQDAAAVKYFILVSDSSALTGYSKI